MLGRYVKAQLFVLLCGGLVGPLFLVVYFALGAEMRPYIGWMFWVGLLITAADVLIAIGLASYRAKSDAISKMLEANGVLALGSATYCLYLLHFNTFVLIHNHHLPERLHFARWDPWVSYVVVILFALAARKWIEHPCQKWIGNQWKRRKESRRLAAAV